MAARAFWRYTDTLNAETAIKILEKTIWNPDATVIESVKGTVRRIAIYYKDDTNGLTNIYELHQENGEWHLYLIDAWKPDSRYLDSLKK